MLTAAPRLYVHKNVCVCIEKNTAARLSFSLLPAARRPHVHFQSPPAGDVLR